MSSTRSNMLRGVAMLAALLTLFGCGARRSEQYTAQGDTYLRLKKIPDAAASYDLALKAQPNNAAALLGHARCLALQQKPDEAIAAYQQVIQVDSKREQAYVEAVRLLLAKAQPGEAVAMDPFEVFLKPWEAADPERGGLLRAFVLRQTGKAGEAVELLNGMRNRFPQSVPVRVGLASSYLAAGKPGEAENEAKAVLDSAQADSLPARMTLVEAYRAQGKLAEIVTQLKDLAAQHPNEPGIQLAYARSLLDTGKADDAESIARPILDQFPDSGWANFIVGCCLLQKQSFTEAIECLEAAVTALPQEPIVAAVLTQAQNGGAPAKATQAAPSPGAPGAPVATPSAGKPAAQGAPQPPEKEWMALWRSARLHELVGRRDEFLAKEEPNLRETLVLAALFTGAEDIVQALLPTLPQDSPLHAYIGALKDKNGEAVTKLFDAWKETDDARKILRQNAEGFAYAMLGARARAHTVLSECALAWPDNGVALYNLASVYRAANTPQFAARCLQRLVASHQENREARELLLRVLLEANLESEACQAAETTYSMFPDDTQSLLSLARVYRIAGKSGLAINVLNRAIESQPDNSALKAGLAEALLTADDAAAALKALPAAPAEAEATRVQTTAAFVHARLGEWEAALKACEVIPQPARTLPARLLHASALLRTGSAAEAPGVLAEEASRAKEDRPLLTLLAAMGQSIEGLSDEDAKLAQALKAAPAAMADYASGLALLRSGLNRAAAEDLQKALAATGAQPTLIGMTLEAMARDSDRADRLDVAKGLVSTFAAVPAAWLGLAKIYESAGDVAGEREALDKASKLAPDRPDVLSARSSFFDRQGDAQALLDTYRRFLALNPENPKLNNNVAYCILQVNGDPQEALKYASLALDKLPMDPSVLHTAGLAQLRAGKNEEALKNLSVALQLRPGDPTILLDYGQALIASGKNDEGKAALRLALDSADRFGLEFARRAEAEKILGEK